MQNAIVSHFKHFTIVFMYKYALFFFERQKFSGLFSVLLTHDDDDDDDFPVKIAHKIAHKQ